MDASLRYDMPGHSEPSQMDAGAIELVGKLKRKELRSLAKKVRTGLVGPTSVYYAGVTAPAIAAGMATVVSAALTRANWHEMAVLQASSIVAAMAGISWYLIFMRWSYRHSYGRGTELEYDTHIRVDDSGVHWTRGAMSVSIRWDGISEVKNEAKYLRLCVTDGDDVILPNSWFDKRRDKKAIYQRLKSFIAVSPTSAPADS